MQDAKQIIKKVDALLSERSSMDNLYDQIERFVAPARGQIYDSGVDENSMRRKFTEIYDSTAVLSAQALGAALHSGLTSPAEAWFSLRVRDEDLNNDHEVKMWLSDTARRTYNTIQQSNFNIEANSFYLNDVTFGTPVMFHGAQKSSEKLEFEFKSAGPKEVVFEVGFDGDLESVYRSRQYTAAQLASRFPDTAPDTITKAAERRGTAKQYTVIHCIMKNAAYDGPDNPPLLPPEKRPYLESFILRNPAINLTPKPGGFYEMPVYISKWGDVPGSKFGYSPAISSLPTIIVVNRLVKAILEAASKAVDPAVLVTQRGLISDLDLDPGGVTVVREGTTVVPFENKARFDVSDLNRQNLVTEIRQAFFADQLILPQSDRMTATEIRVRHERMQSLLGPSLYHLQEDFLSPMVERSVMMLLRAGQLMDPPEIMKGVDFDIEFMGPLAKSQRLTAVAGLERGMGMITGIAAFAPEVLDAVKWTEAVKDTLDRLGVPERLLRSSTELAAIRKQKQDQAQVQAQQDQALQRAQTAQAASAAQVNASKVGGLNG